MFKITNISKNTRIFLYEKNLPITQAIANKLVEMSGVEPLTFRVQNGRSTN